MLLHHAVASCRSAVYTIAMVLPSPPQGGFALPREPRPAHAPQRHQQLHRDTSTCKRPCGALAAFFLCRSGLKLGRLFSLCTSAQEHRSTARRTPAIWPTACPCIQELLWRIGTGAETVDIVFGCCSSVSGRKCMSRCWLTNTRVYTQTDTHTHTCPTRD